MTANQAASLALFGPTFLRPFNEAGVLDSADIQVATRLARLCGRDTDDEVLLAVALAVNATRMGSVCFDMTTRPDTTLDPDDKRADAAAAGLMWPQPTGWIAKLAASVLTTGIGAPLQLEGSLLYLDRYLRYEQQLAANLLDRRTSVEGVDEAALTEGLDRLFPPAKNAKATGPDEQRVAAETAVRRRFSVVAGSPGTGKTTTVARIMALLLEQGADSGRRPLIGLAAPTGRAAAGLKEATDAQAAGLDVESNIRNALLEAPAVTLHRLLGWNPRNQSKFRHNATNPLPHDVIIVDESSMIGLSMMTQLVDAIRPDARLILVGDPRQLTSIDVGSAFGDIVGPVTGQDPDRGIVVLQRVHRFGGAISKLSGAILVGDVDAATNVLRGGHSDVSWLETGDDASANDRDARATAIAELQPHWVDLVDAAERGDENSALDALGACRILCAHRDGKYGASTWNELAFRSVADVGSVGHDRDAWFRGRPVLAVENNYALEVFNGDSGVVLRDNSGATVAAFKRPSRPLMISPERLGPLQTAYAATVHRSQGSQFGTVLVVLPPPESQVLSRELLYTAITRAQKRVIILGSQESLAAAIGRQTRRASGLRARLWGAGE